MLTGRFERHYTAPMGHHAFFSTSLPRIYRYLIRVAAPLGLLLALCGCQPPTDYAHLEPGGELVVVTRNSPTTYYIDGDEPTGFDYELARAFAQSQGLTLRVKLAYSIEELLNTLEAGEAHIAMGGLAVTDERAQRFFISESYFQQKPVVVYRSGDTRPRSTQDLVGRDVVALTASSQAALLQGLKIQLPELRWRELSGSDSLLLMQQITDGRAEVAIIDSIELRQQQRLYPRIAAAFILDQQQHAVWLLHRVPEAQAWLERVNEFFATQMATGELNRLTERHFGSTRYASRIGSFTFQEKVGSDLPKWESLIKSVASEYQLDWRLLAAMAYQESHWDPNARSITGVRGMMMLTQSTAQELGVTDRLDPQQSLRGGARFLKDLLRRLPQDIEQPDRLWMALAAYNIGMGHLEDARIITQRLGGDPHNWEDVRKQLPSLQQPETYRSTRFGFARGEEAVTYVDNIRHYFTTLRLRNLTEQRQSAPINIADWLPANLSQSLPTAL